MQQQTQSTLDVIYENWRGYQEKLRLHRTADGCATFAATCGAHVASGSDFTAHHFCPGGLVQRDATG